MSLTSLVKQFATRYGDDVLRLLQRRGDDVVGQTSALSRAGTARNFTKPRAAATRRPTIDPVPSSAADRTQEARDFARRRISEVESGVVPTRVARPEQMSIPGTGVQGAAPLQRPAPVPEFTTTRVSLPRPEAPRTVPVSRPQTSTGRQAPRPEFTASQDLQGPMPSSVDYGTGQSIRQLADRLSIASGKQVTPEMLMSSRGTQIIDDLAPVQITMRPGGLPQLNRMTMANARNAARGLQQGDLTPAGTSFAKKATQAERALDENAARQSLDGMADAFRGVGTSVDASDVDALIRNTLIGGTTLAAGGAGLGIGLMTMNPESKGPGSLSDTLQSTSEPTVPTSMGDATATIEDGNVSDPENAGDPVAQILGSKTIAQNVASGLDVGPESLDPLPAYEGPQAAARIQTVGDNRESVRSQIQQSQPTGLAKYYADRAAMATSPGTNEATVAQLQGMGILNTPQLTEWGKSNPELAYDLLQRMRSAQPVMPSQQSVNMTGQQLVSPMGSDFIKNAAGNTEAKIVGGAGGADLAAATQPYAAPTLMPVGNNAMYSLQGRVSY